MLPVHPIRVSNPFFEGANTVYVIESNPLTIIDTGVATQIAFDRLVQGIQERGLQLDDIGRIILTHKHIDHIGNAWRIQQMTGAEILIHESEVKAISKVDAQGERFASLVNRRFEDWGVPSSERADSKKIPDWEIESAHASALTDGQRIDLGNGSVEVIHTPGHTMGSICLLYGPYLFTGDHVLEDISPNVGGGDIRQRGLLRHFLGSLQRVQDVVNKPQVMPGHGMPFHELAPRCEALEHHHRERLSNIQQILSEQELTVFEVASQLFGTLDDFHIFLGCAEANAHLEYLIDENVVEERENRYRQTQ